MKHLGTVRLDLAQAFGADDENKWVGLAYSSVSQAAFSFLILDAEPTFAALADVAKREVSVSKWDVSVVGMQHSTTWSTICGSVQSQTGVCVVCALII